jgi:purine-binding chemotaxis protein CheW
MVDLVKIRKKAKQKKEDERAAGEPAASSPEVSREPVPPSLPGLGQGVLRRASPAQDDTASAAPLQPAIASPAQDDTASAAPLQSAIASPAREDIELAAVPSRSTAASPVPNDNGKGDRAMERLNRFKEEVGRKREGMTAKKESDAGRVSNEIELFTFLIAGEQYAVDIDRIVGIVTPRAVTRVPNSDPSVIGIMSLRGTIVTLLDIRRRLSHPSRTSVPDSHIVVIEQRGETLGFQVDRVLRVVKMAPNDLEPHPVVHSSEHSESILGVFHQGGSLTILLDLERLLSQ